MSPRGGPVRMKRSAALLAAQAIFALLPVLAHGQLPQADDKVSDPQTILSKRVPLVSDTCPVVHPGDFVTLDWNPGFEQAWAVAALSHVALGFASLDDNGVTFRSRPTFELEGKSVAVNDMPSINGYFRMEIPVSRRLRAGVYRLVDARVRVKLLPDFTGAVPVMTVSPVRDRFCITVQPSGIPTLGSGS